MEHSQLIAILQTGLDFIVWPALAFVIFAVVFFGWLILHTCRHGHGKWEAVKDTKGEMWRVRWSTPNAHGEFLYIRHYSGLAARHFAEKDADHFNEEGWLPEDML